MMPPNSAKRLPDANFASRLGANFASRPDANFASRPGANFASRRALLKASLLAGQGWG